MNAVEREVLKIAGEAYDVALDSGSFSVADLGDAVADDLLARLADDQSVARDLIATAAHSAIRRIDRERTKPTGDASLLDDLDRAIPVDAGHRIARRRMTATDWSKHLAHVAENVSRVTASAARENDRFAALAPYLVDAATTEDALAAWSAANPGAVLP